MEVLEITFSTDSPTMRCGTCGKVATHAITDAPAGTYSCSSCLIRAVEYGKACNDLEKLVRGISIPGSRVTTDEVEAARLRVEALI